MFARFSRRAIVFWCVTNIYFLLFRIGVIGFKQKNNRKVEYTCASYNRVGERC